MNHLDSIIHFQPAAEALQNLGSSIVLVTDSNVAQCHSVLLSNYQTIVIPAGEEYKNGASVQYITEQLLQLQAHRKTVLVGVGGGVITDITGFVAATYMRGLPFGFIPTTLLAMADAAIGGKNGINFGLQKNLIGTIRQPDFITYDTTLLATLPATEWSNGFAEIIKYACLFDAALFDELEAHTLQHYQQNNTALTALIQRCTSWKNKIVAADEREHGNRKLLNFGHTAGHALETLYQLPHGFAVGLGMLIACRISEQLLGLDSTVTNRLHQLLQQYGLPTAYVYNTDKVMELLMMDKKRNTNTIDYILLQHIGSAVIRPLPFSAIEKMLASFSHASHH